MAVKSNPSVRAVYNDLQSTSHLYLSERMSLLSYSDTASMYCRLRHRFTAGDKLSQV